MSVGKVREFFCSFNVLSKKSTLNEPANYVSLQHKKRSFFVLF